MGRKRRQPRQSREGRNCKNCSKAIPDSKRADAIFCTDKCRYEHWISNQDAD